MIEPGLHHLALGSFAISHVCGLYSSWCGTSKDTSRSLSKLLDHSKLSNYLCTFAYLCWLLCMNQSPFHHIELLTDEVVLQHCDDKPKILVLISDPNKNGFQNTHQGKYQIRFLRSNDKTRVRVNSSPDVDLSWWLWKWTYHLMANSCSNKQCLLLMSWADQNVPKNMHKIIEY